MPTWKPAFPEHKPFKCCTAWHLRNSGLYLAVHVFIGGLTAGGENPFFSSISRVSAFFESDYETTRRVFKNLTKMGWLRYDHDGRKYWYVSHDAWMAANPGKCQERFLLQWQVEADPFVGQLYAAAGGKFYVREGWVIGLRKLAGDAEFLDLFRKELASAKSRKSNGDWRKTSPKECFWVVYKYFKNKAHQKANCG